MPDDANTNTNPAPDDASKNDAAAAAKLARQEQVTKTLGVGGPPRNLTRESLELALVSQLIEKGKSEKEAQKLAAQRALQMIPDPS